jgi:hypothetical protein
MFCFALPAMEMFEICGNSEITIRREPARLIVIPNEAPHAPEDMRGLTHPDRIFINFPLIKSKTNTKESLFFFICTLLI